MPKLVHHLQTIIVVAHVGCSITAVVLSSILLAACGSSQNDGTNGDSPNSPRQAKVITGGDGTTGGTTSGGTGSETIVDAGRTNRTLNPNVFVQVNLPTNYTGYCNITNLAHWTIEGTNPQGIVLQNANSCTVGIKLLSASWHDNMQITVLARLMIDATHTMEYRIVPYIRKAPVINFQANHSPANPEFGFNLNENMPQYTGGQNYNCETGAQKMRFIVNNPTTAYFRDLPNSCSANSTNANNRSFTLPIQASDISQVDPVNNIGTSDFQYSVSCNPVASNHPNYSLGYAFNTAGACANYCPFTISQSSPSSVTVQFSGAAGPIPFVQNSNVFLITNPNACWRDGTNNSTPISFTLNIHSGGGTTSRTVAYLQTEAD